MLSLIKFDPKCPTIARNVGRSLVSSLNVNIINLASRIHRTNMYGITEASGVDGFNDKLAADADTIAGEENLVEQGFDQVLENHFLLSLFITIRDHIAEDVDEHAGKVRSLVLNKLIPNQFDLTQSIKDSYRFLMNIQRDIPPQVLKAEADALGLSVDEIVKAHNKIAESNKTFMKENEEAVMEIIHSCPGFDGTAEEAFNRLPAIVKMRLIFKADQGCARAIQRETIMYVQRGMPDAPGSIRLIFGVRQDLRKYLETLEADADFRKELDEALERGAQYPTLPELTIKQQAA